MGRVLNRRQASTELHLPVGQPFELTATLESGQAHRWKRWRAERSDDWDGWHWSVVSGRIVRLHSGKDPGTGFVGGVDLVSPDPGPPEGLLELFHSYFRLGDDIETIRHEISQDPRVEETVRLHEGLRLLRVEPWECLISFICSANSNLARIHSNIESISDRFGDPVEVDGQRRHTFPDPEALSRATDSDLRGLGLGFRAPYVLQAAKAVARGEPDLEELRRVPYSEAKERLIELPGVGSKIADCVLLHSLDKLEAFPIDVWVRRALVDWYFPGRKPPPDRYMLEWAQDHFGRYAGYAELYLFHARRLKGRNRRAANGPAVVS